MNAISLPALLPLLAQDVARTTFEFGRLQSSSNSGFVLPVAVFVAIGVFIWMVYRRDAVELHGVLRWLLVALRTAVFLGLLLFYLQPQWRTELEMVRNSRALLLVDTSLSMGLTDSELSAAEPSESRAERVAATLADSSLLDQLRETHDVVVFRFDEGLDHDRVALGKLVPDVAGGPNGGLAEDAGDPADSGDTAGEAVDWREFLAPDGAETQLGTALGQLIADESGLSLAGIVVISDGGQNAGVGPEAAITTAHKERIPVFAVGVGSDRRPANVRVSDLVVPARAYPGDNYTVTGYLQPQGMAGQAVEVELLLRESVDGAEGAAAGGGQIVASHQVTLGQDGEVMPVRFELTPEEVGRWSLCFRVRVPLGDHNPADDQREAEIEVVLRKNHVLLLAGGPTRDYRFLRTLLFRDRSTTLDVLLQSAQPGISQEADKLLDEFPTTRPEMFDYDCVVAFDPDWQALSVDQVDLLETWVAEQGGGLIVVAGPVFTGGIVGGWVEDKAMVGIRALYPVEFHQRFSVLQDRRYTAEEPWPLEFTREGLEAEYLWLEDTATAAATAWAGFPGVFSYCPLRGPKPGATVLARFSDPRTGSGGQQPVFFATQFYGSGRVFFVGSGEMWRLRRLDPVYFERFYTKLIRHVSQGRLLRQSSRGVLLVGRERYMIGNTVEVRTQLTDALLEPLDAPGVPLQVLHAGKTETVTLLPDPTRLGTYVGSFPVFREGPYQLVLEVPESAGQHLMRRIQVDVPDLERENPQRNDALLSGLARGTAQRNEQQGLDIPAEYYVGLAELVNPSPPKRPLAELLRDRTQTVIFTAAPDDDFRQTWLMWMMLALCGLLCLEWLIRRLAKLA